MKKHLHELIEVRNALQGLWVAAVFALVLRAFLVEAFVIPTGSMAPRLMGQHVVVTCPDCGTSYPREFGFTDTGSSSKTPESECPNCHEPLKITSDFRVKNGDRVMVFKLPEGLRSFERWDVIVFRDTESNSQNFIKRLVGLPGEALKIVHGDIYHYPIEDTNGDKVIDEFDLPVNVKDLEGWQIVRKDYDEQQILWQPLFDSDYVPANRPERIISAPPGWTEIAGNLGSWDMKINNGRAWRFNSQSAAVLKFADSRPSVFRATNAYNTDEHNRFVQGYCNDLRLETIVEPAAGDGSLRLILSHYDNLFAAEVDLSTSEVKLLRIARPESASDADWAKAELWGSAKYDFVASGEKPLRIAIWQADFTVGVAIDDRPVIVTEPDQYIARDTEVMAWLSRNGQPRPDVLIEGVRGDYTLWRTKVSRDVYYTIPYPPRMHPRPSWDYAYKEYPELYNGSGTLKSWAQYDNPIVLRKYLDGRCEYDEFFMCGDNSPSSHDSRRWTGAAPSLKLYDENGKAMYRLGTVPRYNIVGRAFMVYWPSGYPIAGDRKIPLAPDVGKIRRIR